MRICFDILNCVRGSILSFFSLFRQRSTDGDYDDLDLVALSAEKEKNSVKNPQSIYFETPVQTTGATSTDKYTDGIRRPTRGGSESPDKILTVSSYETNPILNNHQDIATCPYSLYTRQFLFIFLMTTNLIACTMKSCRLLVAIPHQKELTYA